MRYLISTLTALTLLAANAQAQYLWTGTGGNNDIDNPGNWADDFAPVPPVSVYDALVFSEGGVVNNTFTPGSELGSLIFYWSEAGTNAFAFGGNEFRAQIILFASNDTAEVQIDAPLSGDFLHFELTSPGMYQQDLYINQGISLSGTDQVLSIEGTGASYAAVHISGSGQIESAGTGTVAVSYATLSLDNRSEAVTGRIDSDLGVELYPYGKIEVIGSATTSVAETIENLSLQGAAIIGVENPNLTQDTSLTINNLEASADALALYYSSGANSQALGDALPSPRIFLDGQVATPFLGPQSFYLTGTVAGGEPYQFAAYSGTDGVIAATNAYDLSVSGTNINALVSGSVTLSNTVQLNSLAFNGDTLDGTGTLQLNHLLVTQPGAYVDVTLDFGNSAGTITAENWDPSEEHLIGLGGVISGSNSLTFRGGAETYVMADATFTGALNVYGASLNLTDEGAFNNVQSIDLGVPETENVSQILMYGVTQAGVPIDRLPDTAPINVSGISQIVLISDFSTDPDEEDTGAALPVNETIGAVTVSGTGSFVNLVVDMTLGPYDPAAPPSLNVLSLAFAASASNSSLQLVAGAINGSITVTGDDIVLENGNALYYTMNVASSTITTPKVSIELGEDTSLVSFYAFDTAHMVLVKSDFTLDDGELVFDGISAGEFTIEGDMLMGDSLLTLFDLGLLDTLLPVITIDGDLTLAGSVEFYQTHGFASGTWLLFEVSGSITDNGWDVYGSDGDYSYEVIGQQVYLTAVPEPSTWALLGLGLGAVTFLRRRAAKTARSAEA